VSGVMFALDKQRCFNVIYFIQKGISNPYKCIQWSRERVVYWTFDVILRYKR